MGEERPMSVASSALEREMDHVRSIREKIGMAKEGKDVTQYGPGDSNWYEIDEAERDVVDLKRMRRQIRCLFGPNVYADDLNVVASGVRLPKITPPSPESDMYTGNDFGGGGGGGRSNSHKPSGGAFSSASNQGAYSRRAPQQQSQQQQGPNLDILKNAGANWAEDVVKAAVQPGNQWAFDR